MARAGRPPFRRSGIRTNPAAAIRVVRQGGKPVRPVVRNGQTDPRRTGSGDSVFRSDRHIGSRPYPGQVLLNRRKSLPVGRDGPVRSASFGVRSGSGPVFRRPGLPMPRIAGDVPEHGPCRYARSMAKLPLGCPASPAGHSTKKSAHGSEAHVIKIQRCSCRVFDMAAGCPLQRRLRRATLHMIFIL